MSEELVEQILQANSDGEPLRIVGGDSKAFYGHDLSHLKPLRTSGLNQVVSYEPSELVVQVEAGYPIDALVDLLAEHHQMLGFEPADFGGSTVGGVVASGLSGSRRPFLGACRDFVLGMKVIDGQGNCLEFGGQVMKNVAGYDVSRLLTGSLGCLGVITEVSFKVLPKPPQEISTCRPTSRGELLDLMRQLSVHPETSGLAYYDDQLYVRFSGSESSVVARSKEFCGAQIDGGFWRKLDSLELFAEQENLWRVSTRANQIGNGIDEALVVDWGGAQRWLSVPVEVETGYLTQVKSSDNASKRFAPLSPYVAKIHARLKQTFDPRSILNPGKMYPEL